MSKSPQVKLQNHVHRSGFDLSRKNAFTAKVGELLPIMVEEVLPGDKFNIDTEWFTRTMPVNTAAYTRIREYVDFYFVPNRLLWRYWPQFITNVNVNQSCPEFDLTALPYGQQFGNNQPYFSSLQVGQLVSALSVKGKKDEVGFDASLTTTRLLHYLGYGRYAVKDSESNVALNPFPLLAYQKIYQDFYRFTQWEDCNPMTFNVDYLSGASGQSNSLFPLSDIISAVNTDSGFSIADTAFALRYSNWHKDLFMGLLPRPQYGDESVVPFNFSGIVDGVNGAMTLNNPVFKSKGDTPWMLGSNLQFHSNGVVRSQTDLQTNQFRDVDGIIGDVSIQGGRTPYSGSADLSILSLRKAEALQKWKEITQSQRYDYPTQIDAHFNARPSSALSNMCEYVGGCSGNLAIGEVVNTNLSSDEAGKAYIQGKGVGNGNGHISFQAKEHGVFMAIYHAVPLLDYALNSLGFLNIKTDRESYAIPEFDSIGMQQVRTVHLVDDKSVVAGKLGWTTRYFDYKTAFDEVHGAFLGSLGNWVAPLDLNFFRQHIDSNGSIKDYLFFKIPPSVLNPIFVSVATGSFDTDQLLVNCMFNFKAVRNLSRTGLPY